MQSELKDESKPVERWRGIYQRYRALERDWEIPGAPPEVSRQFFRRTLRGPLARQALLSELHSFGLPPPAPDLLEEALDLREELSGLPGGRHLDDPFDNIYQAALGSLGLGFWEASPELHQVYRGQRNAAWPVVPSIFRERLQTGAFRERLSAIVHALRGLQPGLNDEQAVALAQHYGSELGARTWLIDVTFEPRVAFFFASHGGRTGDIGVVTCMVRNEWEKLSAGGRNRLGAIRLIEVPHIVRIERQRALFLDTSHPDLFEQYVPHSIWFRQHDGIVFEDEHVQPPVSETFLYPADDPLLSALTGLRVVDSDKPLDVAPASDAGEPLSPAEYRAIAASWCETLGVVLDPYRGGTLQVVCDFHTILQEHRDRIEIPERSLLRLYDAAERICEAQQTGRNITAADALYWTFTRVPSETAEWLRELLGECLHKSAMLPSPTALRDELERLANDVGSLRTVSAIGFGDNDPRRVEDNLEALTAEPRWTLLDARGLDAGEVATALVGQREAKELVILVSAAAPVPRPLAALVKAILDKRGIVDLTEEARLHRGDAQSVFILIAGASALADTRKALHGIPYWTFVRPKT